MLDLRQEKNHCERGVLTELEGTFFKENYNV